MAKFSRNAIPDRVVWKQTGTLHDRSYWLAVPQEEMKGGSLVIAQWQGQSIEVMNAQNLGRQIIRLDDRMVDMDQPVIVKWQGKEIFKGDVARTLSVMIQTLAERGDPGMVINGEVAVHLVQVAD